METFPKVNASDFFKTKVILKNCTYYPISFEHTNVDRFSTSNLKLLDNRRSIGQVTNYGGRLSSAAMRSQSLVNYQNTGGTYKTVIGDQVVDSPLPIPRSHSVVNREPLHYCRIEGQPGVIVMGNGAVFLKDRNNYAEFIGIYCISDKILQLILKDIELYCNNHNINLLAFLKIFNFSSLQNLATLPCLSNYYPKSIGTFYNLDLRQIYVDKILDMSLDPLKYHYYQNNVNRFIMSKYQYLEGVTTFVHSPALHSLTDRDLEFVLKLNPLPVEVSKAELSSFLVTSETIRQRYFEDNSDKGIDELEQSLIDQSKEQLKLLFNLT